MRKALIRDSDGQVANVIEWEPGSTWQAPAGHHLQDAQNASPGDTWDGVKFNPRQPTPEELAAQAQAQIEKEKATKRAAANARALAAIEANKTGAPWGSILHDLAVAQGWIEP